MHLKLKRILISVEISQKTLSEIIFLYAYA